MAHTQKTGFTLIELLVVISVIGLLSSVVLASLSGAREEAKYSAARQEINQLRDIVILAQGNKGNNLTSITGNTCTYCMSCRDGDPQGAACAQDTRTAFEKIYTAADRPINSLDSLMYDPWGTPYGLDENEGERIGDECVPDSITSAGPDQEFSGDGSEDDLRVELQYGEECI